MTLRCAIRPEQMANENRITHIHRAAFRRDQEARLVHRLRRDGDLLLSLVAEDEQRNILGHIAFSPCYAEHPSQPLAAGCALGPLAVDPAYQHQGVGQQLVTAALAHEVLQAYPWMVVVGKPAYYQSFGFESAHALGLKLPIKVPPEAFMVRWPETAERTLPAGTLVRYHSAFLRV